MSNFIETRSIHSQGAEEEAIKLQNSTTEAAEVLTRDVGVSVRDAGQLLGLSHQRVHQLLTASSRKKKAK